MTEDNQGVVKLYFLDTLLRFDFSDYVRGRAWRQIGLSQLATYSALLSAAV